MTPLDFPTYLAHVRSESQRFRDVLATCDPAARVPSCPEWTAADLLWHLGGDVQHFWAWVVEHRPDAPEAYAEPPRPDSYAGLLDAFDLASAALVSALQQADPAEPAWTWSSEQTVGFSYRRQAHEALIHRVDAELTAGAATPVDRALAADGVAETLDVMYGGCPPWGTFAPLPHHLRLDLTDVDEAVWVQLGQFTGTDPEGASHDEGDIHVVADPGVEPDATIAGPAAALDLWLWKRADDTDIRVAGDRGVYDRFRSAVAGPIN